MLKKVIIIAVFTLFLLVNPTSTSAFDVGKLIDPACFFACDDDPEIINNTNSYNTNSNIDSPGATVAVAGTPNYTYSDSSYNEPLVVSCYPTSSTADIGDTVIWRASVDGGNGNYNISWTGTNGLSGSGSSISKTYNSSGSKGASVTVTSGSRTASKNCSEVYVYNDSYHNDYNYDYDDDYYDDNYSSSLSASCYPDRSSVETGDTVEWRASVHGGNGSYRITWSGTNGLSDTGSSATIRYRSEGTKHATIRVTSGSRTLTRECNTVRVDDDYNNDYDDDYYDDRDYNYPLSVSCSVTSTFATVGTRVVWESYASGGSGRYTYEWRGTDSARGSDRNLELFYNSPGPKTASVTVRSGGRSVTQACMNSILIGVPRDNYYNPTPTYTAPTKTVVKYVEVPAKKTIEEPKVATTTAPVTASLFSLVNIAWGWVSFLIIIILFFTVVYLVLTRKK